MKSKILFALFVLIPASAHAHPGQHHGDLLDAIAHLLSEPDHIALALIAVVAGVVGARFYRRRVQVRRQAKHR